MLYQVVFQDMQTTSVNQAYCLILSATEQEVHALTRGMENTSVSSISSRTAVSGKINNIFVKIIVTGPGIVNTSQALTAAVEKQTPFLVIQTGCCGAFQESELSIGDIAVAGEEIDAHLGIESSSGNGIPDPLPFAVLSTPKGAYFHRYPVNLHFLEQFERQIPIFSQKFSFVIKIGPFLTVSTITATQRRARDLFACYNAIAEQMEGSAAAHICALYGIPLIEIRGVSNTVGHRDKSSWDVRRASQNCCDVLRAFLETITVPQPGIL